MKQGYFFMYMPLEPQLKLKFQYQNLMQNIKKYKRIFEEPSSSYRDILYGEAYAKIKNLKYSDNISLQFNIDGIPMYRKSNYQIWPIQCMINELPPNERKDHILMCGLWIGPHKPNMNVFLKPFVTELSNLSRSGFKWIDATNSKQIVTKVFPIICSSDAPDRAAIHNFIQYNGKYGCGFCQHSGERVERGKGFCRIYPLQQPLPEIRSFEQCVNFAEEASLTGKAVHGVKGPTELMKLYRNFDLVQSFVPDYMHAVLLGEKGHLCLLNDFALYIKEFESLEARLADAPDIDIFVCSVGPLDGCFEVFLHFCLKRSVDWAELGLPGYSDDSFVMAQKALTVSSLTHSTGNRKYLTNIFASQTASQIARKFAASLILT
ncbi:hypothetical protein AVEN_162550-1 [Araneus ventricosus]|uniref:Uncharacterized protein n=1 Tax=Araneus ventricosus TaxID=182803 RepID=A0A4Y2KTF6_ARAVE|nr:hypothetical protein AVEN_162550-1 [Araneus ventricosus]